MLLRWIVYLQNRRTSIWLAAHEDLRQSSLKNRSFRNIVMSFHLPELPAHPRVALNLGSAGCANSPL